MRPYDPNRRDQDPARSEKSGMSNEARLDRVEETLGDILSRLKQLETQVSRKP
jgi:hypothetical protein